MSQRKIDNRVCVLIKMALKSSAMDMFVIMGDKSRYEICIRLCSVYIVLYMCSPVTYGNAVSSNTRALLIIF